MPAVRMFGRKWRVSSDFLPVFAGIGLVFHFCWVIFIIVWPFGVTKVRKCDNTTAGRHFLASVALFFILYVLSFIQELLITLIGLRGETSGWFPARTTVHHLSTVGKAECYNLICRNPTGNKQAQIDEPGAVHSVHQLGWPARSCK